MRNKEYFTVIRGGSELQEVITIVNIYGSSFRSNLTENLTELKELKYMGYILTEKRNRQLKIHN